MKPNKQSPCCQIKTCPRCGCPIDMLTLVCPRCREPIPGGCSGNCSKCGSKVKPQASN
ncbi:hypothetical protein [Desulfotomaculum nigrificans]|uniref:hypothetical protein n=1 Tax=Desulfotomaculum nigrificans TaxID=1565 RepID=UPI0002DC2869|nr:hypothetical protein [Desulfotomaculum nigrificans]